MHRPVPLAVLTNRVQLSQQGELRKVHPPQLLNWKHQQNFVQVGVMISASNSIIAIKEQTALFLMDHLHSRICTLLVLLHILKCYYSSSTAHSEKMHRSRSHGY